MAKQGLRVLRFSDGEVFSELEAVTATIWEEL
jgi:very-short-patch-repair endonuclease